MSKNSKAVWEILSPERIKEEYPLSANWKICVDTSIEQTRKILKWESDKKLLIIWPCSADFEESLLKYAEFIKKMREKYKDQIEIIMRFYTWKPRTVWWWKWLSVSRPWETPNISKWLCESRAIALKLLEMWVPLADEMLHPELIKMFEDLYSYLAVWARSWENQYHREVSSWLYLPIWIKNPTSWDIDTMVNSILAWQSPSTYVLWSIIYDSIWNDMVHWILRWWRINGKNIPNYSKEDLKSVIKLLFKRKVQNPSIIIDTNHENSDKHQEKQIEIMRDVFEYLRILESEWLNISPFKWFMVESYIDEWRQDWPKDGDESKVIKWRSLTDPCIGLSQTEDLIGELAQKVDETRKKII